MAEHRVPVLGGALHRYVDPAHSSDPRFRAVVTALGTLQDSAPAPRAHFRAELRAQLVAVAPRLVAEGPAAELVRHTPESLLTGTEPTVSSRAARVRLVLDRLPSIRLGRAGAIVAAAAAVVAMVLSGAVWMSRSALPGDTLYGLKRASEDAQLSLTTGNVARGRELLSFAKTRADEVSALLGAAPATSVSSRTAGLVTSTLNSADDDVRQAAQLLGAQAVQSQSAAPLSTMAGWAPDQLARLQAIAGRTPAGNLHDRATSSANLVSAALVRATTLQSQIGCTCLNGGGSDQLGPLPCLICTGPPPLPITVPGGTGSPGAGNGTAKSSPAVTNGGGSAAATPGSGGPNPYGSPNPSGSLPVPQLPSVTVPSIPLPSTPPLTINSCGVSVTLGPVGVGAGTCGIHLGT